MFFFFLYFLVLFCFFIFSNYIIWWGLFILITIIFFFICKGIVNFRFFVNYFVIQEVLGIFFLIFSIVNFQFLVLVIKFGISPFFFWITGIINFLNGFRFIWFIGIHKIPILPVIVYFSINLLFIFIGLLFVYIAMIFFKSLKILLFLSSVEGFNWILVNLFFRRRIFLFISFYYIFIRSSIIYSKYTRLSDNTFELVLVLLNIPLLFRFFIKFFGFFIINNFIFFLIISIPFIVIGLISIFFLLVINSSSSLINFSFKNYFLVFFLFNLIIFICFIIKSILYYLDRIKFL